MITARLSPGGLAAKSPCVYVITASRGRRRVFYVGRTLTASGTGMSCPYKRLGTHLAKRGKTQSSIWRTATELREDWFDNGAISFCALPISPKQVAVAEKWVMSQFEVSTLLNRRPCREAPGISSILRQKLARLDRGEALIWGATSVQ